VIVADANLLIALVGDSSESAAAQEILARRPRWHAPILWRSEAANTLLGYVRRGILTLRGAQNHWSTLADVIGGREHATDTRRVLALASSSGCTAYDCDYVAVAEALSLPLVTSDREILRAFSRMAMTPTAFLARL
jgi:predicted nucleic acid-binding protein